MREHSNYVIPKYICDFPKLIALMLVDQKPLVVKVVTSDISQHGQAGTLRHFNLYN